MRKIYFWFGLLLIILTSCSQKGEEVAVNYKNPVYEPVLADPSIIKAEDQYFYAYGTEDAWGDDPDTKLIPVVRSKNLINWEYVGEAFMSKPTWKSTGSLWAPDISIHDGQYYLYYSISMWGDRNPGIGVAVSTTPSGPFKDKGKLFTSEEIGVKNSIDPFFIEEAGRNYLFWGSFNGIYGIELTEDGLSTIGEKFQIAGNDYEAPYIIKRNEAFYFFGSRGTCCDGEKSSYNVAVAKSDTLKGPYYDKNGNKLLENGGTQILSGKENGRFVGPGHNSIIKDDENTDWIVYHAIEKDDPLLWTGASRRPLMIDRITWNNSWPVIDNNAPSENEKRAPTIN